MRIVCLSDTHLQCPPVPDGDLFIHAGDMTTCGSVDQLAKASAWLNSLPHRHKVVIAGNHDWIFQRSNEFARMLLGPKITYLQDEAVEIEGLTVYGSPWQPYFQGWAFNLQRHELCEKWNRIPLYTDILVTHGPPSGIGDQTSPHGELLGCCSLAETVRRVRPRLHVYGHIHPGHGRRDIGPTIFVNAAICRDDGQGLNPATVVDLPCK